MASASEPYRANPYGIFSANLSGMSGGVGSGKGGGILTMGGVGGIMGSDKGSGMRGGGKMGGIMGSDKGSGIVGGGTMGGGWGGQHRWHVAQPQVSQWAPQLRGGMYSVIGGGMGGMPRVMGIGMHSGMGVMPGGMSKGGGIGGAARGGGTGGGMGGSMGSRAGVGNMLLPVPQSQQAQQSQPPQPSWSQAYGCLWQHIGQNCRFEYPPHAHLPLPLVFRRISLSTSDRMRSHSSPCPPAETLSRWRHGSGAPKPLQTPSSAMMRLSASSARAWARTRGNFLMGVIRAVTTGRLGSSMTSMTSRVSLKIPKPLASVFAIWEGRSVLRGYL